MLIEDNAPYGRLLGTLKSDYLYLVKGDIIYIQYTRELLQYMLVISTYVNKPNKLEPVMKEELALQKLIKKKCVKELHSRFQSGEFKMQHQRSLKDLNVSNIASDNSSLASGSIVFDRGFEASFEAKSSDKKIKRNKWKTRHKFAFTGIFLATIGLFSLIFSTTIETKYQDTRLAYANTMYGQDYIAWIENITGGNEEYDKDLDLDGLTNIEEFYLHSHPDNRDCNNNGKIDVLDYLRL